MMLGIILKGINSVYFKSKLDFIFEFIPQFIFMSVTFGYMDFMIFYKWTVNYLEVLPGTVIPMTNLAPSIITLLM
jgi:V-type H+-transporting ATPase subunit a